MIMIGSIIVMFLSLSIAGLFGLSSDFNQLARLVATHHAQHLRQHAHLTDLLNRTNEHINQVHKELSEQVTNSNTTAVQETDIFNRLRRTNTYDDFNSLGCAWDRYDYTGSEPTRFSVSVDGNEAQLNKHAEIKNKHTGTLAVSWMDVVETFWSVLPKTFVLEHTTFRIERDPDIAKQDVKLTYVHCLNVWVRVPRNNEHDCVQELVHLLKSIWFVDSDKSYFNIIHDMKIKFDLYFTFKDGIENEWHLYKDREWSR